VKRRGWPVRSHRKEKEEDWRKGEASETRSRRGGGQDEERDVVRGISHLSAERKHCSIEGTRGKGAESCSGLCWEKSKKGGHNRSALFGVKKPWKVNPRAFFPTEQL